MYFNYDIVKLNKSVQFILCYMQFIAITKSRKVNTYDDILYIKWVQIFCYIEPTLDEKSKGLT